ncbi:MAG TPA: L,D-transpeptidase [Acidimicrobiales bacterium]|nr:L,D-transpeptidase [Acidimicrobiales bacterium]
MRQRLAVLLAAGFVIAGCGSGGSDSRRTSPTTARPPEAVTTTTIAPRTNVVAQAKIPAVPIFDAPDQPAPARTMENPGPGGDPLVFLVKEQQPDWLNVYLPVRPNGSTGWVHSADVDLATHDFRILVEIGAHQITVWKGEEVFDQEPIGVGTTDTPTPGGLYYTAQLKQPVDKRGQPIANGPYGPYAYGLSGFSDVLVDFAGGDGMIGIHGTNDPSSIGRDSSHGCIRMSNEGITKLAESLPLGVPVEIQP